MDKYHAVFSLWPAPPVSRASNSQSAYKQGDCHLQFSSLRICTVHRMLQSLPESRVQLSALLLTQLDLYDCIRTGTEFTSFCVPGKSALAEIQHNPNKGVLLLQ